MSTPTGNRVISPFLAQVRQDFKDVLMNLGEFGRTYEFVMRGQRLYSYDDDGNRLDGLVMVQDAVAGYDDLYANGVDTQRIRVVIRDVDIDPPPVPYEEIYINKQAWTVLTVNNTYAQCILTLDRRKS